MSGNPNGRKGAQAELDVFRYLAAVFGRLVHRPHQEGHIDVGDLHLSPWALQVKNYANITVALNIGVAAADVQAGHAGEHYGAAVIKKRGASIAQARVAMTLRTFRRVTARLLRAEDLLRHHAPEAYADHVARIPEDE